MTGKQNQLDDSENNQSRIKLIADKRRLLDEKSAQIEAEIRSCFEGLTKLLRSREKQLLRQAEAIHRQQLSLIETSLNFLPSSVVVLNDKNELEERICQFGNIETHGSNSITVKDVEPYKVADYQDANKDHVSFDKSITKSSDQKARDHLSLPRCKDFISDYRTVRISSLPSTLFTNNELRDSHNIKANALKIFKDTLSISRCSPLLIIKRKLGLTHVSLDGLHAFDKSYSQNVQSFGMSCMTTESSELDKLTNGATETNLREFDKEVLDQDDSEIIRSPKEREKNDEHPVQIKQWLQQILAETEIEPAIYEIGQFTEISKAKLCNEL
ncbi:hypothetical protein ALC56_04200 [Trachymyrmex septentrionalis]|uniref:Uncharacterized protein n=1 Tax=Trachymyrmex septentrionalis TaxID=34720 RepID=A0A195FLB3_9HYME|nr:PREDICTED: uncharacterized protein LOC108746854 [Trachymyrmex septentrionalis]KYN41052.1 hypothetical protein ALC56_04200 [Trachymyrmex septentrionalis]